MYVVFPKSEVGSKIPLKFHLKKLFKAELEKMLKEVEPTKKKEKESKFLYRLSTVAS